MMALVFIPIGLLLCLTAFTLEHKIHDIRKDVKSIKEILEKNDNK